MNFSILTPKEIHATDDLLTSEMRDKISGSIRFLGKGCVREDNFNFVIEFENFCLVFVCSFYYQNLGESNISHSDKSFHFLAKGQNKIIYSFYCKNVDIPFEEFSYHKRHCDFTVFRIKTWSPFVPNIFFVFCKNLTEVDRFVLERILPEKCNKESRIILVK